MKKSVCFLVFILFILGCGPEADYWDTQEEVIETSDSLTLPQEPARTFFYSRGPENEAETFTAFGSTDFRISHFGDCEYVFDLFFRLPEGLPGREGLPRDIYYDTITSGQGDLENTWRLFLPEAEYFLDVETDCQWLVEISKASTEGETSEDEENDGTDGGTGNGGDGGDNEDCNCQGCCSQNDGVVCRDGVTMCGNGTPLSETCRKKGCIAKGCQGCP